MRLKLTLTNLSGEALLPINYQYNISAVIYRLIQKSSHEFSKWLHQEGVKLESKQFKLFTFSNLELPYGQWKREGEYIRFSGDNCFLRVSFALPDSYRHLLQGIFQQESIRISDHYCNSEFRIDEVLAEHAPEFSETMTFRCLSPICVSQTIHEPDGRKLSRYMHPEDSDYERHLISNLMNKMKALHPQASARYNADDFSFELIGKPHSKLIAFKKGSPEETKVRGYLYEFKLTAPTPYQKLGYYAGFSEKNSLGFGCVKVKGD